MMNECEPVDSFVRKLIAKEKNFQFLIEPDLKTVGNFIVCFNECLKVFVKEARYSINIEPSMSFYPHDLTNNLIKLINPLKIKYTVSKEYSTLLTINFVSDETDRSEDHNYQYQILFRNYAKIELRNLPSSKGNFVIGFPTDVNGLGPRIVEAFVVPTNLRDPNPFIWYST